jgi:hypothetical protein
MLCTRCSCWILIKLESSGQTFEKTQIPNFVKICRVGAELFYAYGRTDMTKLLFAVYFNWAINRVFFYKMLYIF